jgi:hypothetical protein
MMWYRKLGYEGQPRLEAYFKKKKSDGKLGFFSNFNKRWFTLDFDKWILCYSAAPNKRIAWTIPFKDILRVNSELNRDKLRLTTSSKQLKLLSNQIVIYTTGKVYTLYAIEGNTRSIWSSALSFIVKSRNENSLKKSISCVRSNIDHDDFPQSSEMYDSPEREDSLARTKQRFTSTGRMDSLITSPLWKRSTNRNSNFEDFKRPETTASKFTQIL